MLDRIRLYWWQRRLVDVSRQLSKRLEDEQLQARAYALWEMALRHQSILKPARGIAARPLSILHYLGGLILPATRMYLMLAGHDAQLDYLNITHLRYHRSLEACTRKMEFTESGPLWRKCEQESLRLFI
ncbi:hypothetical protein GC177_07180 [bacterium]|nr:hypothetical protein [bacterium]